LALALLSGLFACACGGTSSISISNPIFVTITSPASPPTILQGQTVNITASVSFDSSNEGVAWSLSGQTCTGAACGTLTNQTTTSVTYNAPTPVATNLTVSVTATSVADHFQSSSIAITVTPPPILSVTITNKISTINAGAASVTLNATVQNDPTNKGVMWTLTAPDGSSACSPACGALSNPQTFSVTYTPPPTAASELNPIIRAVSVADGTKFDMNEFLIFSASEACGTGNESTLKGEYAFLLQGTTGSGLGVPLEIAASFAANGTGGITGGSEDVNEFLHVPPMATIQASGSSYSVGPDNRGCLTLATTDGSTRTFRFSLGSINAGIASRGDIIEFDFSGSADQVNASGILRLQDPNSFSLGALSANYAFGVDGYDLLGKHLVLAGSFALSQGAISNGVFDRNDGGATFLDNTGGVGTIQSISTTTGRATATLGADGFNFSLVIYVVNASEIFIFCPNTASIGDVFSGRALATAASFSASSVSPQYIFRSTGNFLFASVDSIGLASLSNGTVSATIYQDADGTASTQNFSGNYAVDANSGRTVISNASGTALILYLTNPADGVAAISFGLDAAASLGVFDIQPAVTYSNSSLSGSFFFGSSELGDITIYAISGTASISSGALTGTEDEIGLVGLLPGSTVNATLSISADGSGNLGMNSVAVTNGTVLYFIDETGGSPPAAGVQVFEQ
jgi:hypothetical protein